MQDPRAWKRWLEQHKSKPTNFQRITASPEALAEFIIRTCLIYDEQNMITLVDALNKAKKNDNTPIYEYLYSEILEWLKQESKE